MTELNGNATPELVLAWVDAPDGYHNAYYRVCWDLKANGQFTSCSPRQQIPGWVGLTTQGADLAVRDLNGNGRPEMVFGWIDAPDGVNQGYYRVGWDLDANGKVASWGADPPQKIAGAFGSQDSGLGLTLADMNSDGPPELVAAWVRNGDGGNEWAYAVGEDLGKDGLVGSWAPGPPIAGGVGSATSAASLASADLVGSDGRPELVVSWIDHPTTGDLAWLRVGQVRPLSGDPDQYPTAVTDTDPTDGVFQVQFQGQTWNVSGEVNWRWDNYNNPMLVSVGGANKTWSVDQSQFVSHTIETSKSYNIEIGGEAKFMGVDIEGSSTYGFEEGSSQSLSWSQGWYMEGQSAGLPGSAPAGKSYKYTPYTYMQEARSAAGEKQAYMVLDYIVPYIGPIASAEASATALGITPGVPVSASPTHPDPDVWYPTNTVAFTWAQPVGDPAVVDGYRWYLDRHPDTVPNEFSQGLTHTVTYEDFADGLWYLHLRARGDGGAWSATAHRAVRLDGHPPQVAIVLDPQRPADNGGWYNTPVTATVTATDLSSSAGQTGSGVVSRETSADGVTWQPYTAPVVYSIDRPLTALWARATDAVGHTSEPISVTFGLDLTAPNSVAVPGCWDAGGDCAAEVATDTMGNQYLRLAGSQKEALSGLKGVAIQINGANWVPVTGLVDGQWFFNSSKEVGAGCHTFDTEAEDRAGNVEAAHTFASGVIWPARSSPDLSGSSLSVVPAQVRPGDTVTFTLSLRNSGWQETWVPIATESPGRLGDLAGDHHRRWDVRSDLAHGHLVGRLPVAGPGAPPIPERAGGCRLGGHNPGRSLDRSGDVAHRRRLSAGGHSELSRSRSDGHAHDDGDGAPHATGRDRRPAADPLQPAHRRPAGDRRPGRGVAHQRGRRCPLDVPSRVAVGCHRRGVDGGPGERLAAVCRVLPLDAVRGRWRQVPGCLAGRCQWERLGAGQPRPGLHQRAEQPPVPGRWPTHPVPVPDGRREHGRIQRRHPRGQRGPVCLAAGEWFPAPVCGQWNRLRGRGGLLGPPGGAVSGRSQGRGRQHVPTSPGRRPESGRCLVDPVYSQYAGASAHRLGSARRRSRGGACAASFPQALSAHCDEELVTEKCNAPRRCVALDETPRKEKRT